MARYYDGFDDETGVTPSRLARFSRERQWPYVRHWFLRMFEDPQNETPRPEGEFMYVWGGPYDALEELQSEFQGFDDDRLADFAQRLEDEQGVVEWAPGRAHPDHERAAEEYAREQEEREEEEDEERPEGEEGVQAQLGEDATPSTGDGRTLEDLMAALEAGAAPRYGDDQERALRAETLRRLDALDAKFDELLAQSAPRPGMGHNMPPEATPVEPAVTINVTVIVEAAAQMATAHEELEKPEPDAAVVAQKSSWLKKLLIGLGIAAASGLAAGATKPIGAAWMAKHPELVDAAVAFLDHVLTWLKHVVPAS